MSTSDMESQTLTTMETTSQHYKDIYFLKLCTVRFCFIWWKFAEVSSVHSVGFISTMRRGKSYQRCDPGMNLVAPFALCVLRRATNNPTAVSLPCLARRPSEQGLRCVHCGQENHLNSIKKERIQRCYSGECLPR
jgi:hypothetical protein